MYAFKVEPSLKDMTVLGVEIRSLVGVIRSLTDIICKKGYIHTYNILGCQIGLMYIDNNTILYEFNTELCGSLRHYPLV